MAGVTIRNLGIVAAQLENVGRRIVQVGDEEVRDIADFIVERAQAYAPRDRGNLEDSIGVLEEGGGSIVIGVDLQHPGTRAKTVSQYAERIETKDGWESLGKNSLAKAQATGEDVGAHFLERAVAEGEAMLRAKLIEKIDRVIMSANGIRTGTGTSTRRGIFSNFASRVRGAFGRFFGR
jgi:hypothetical protein